jgi:DNA polymerase III subunit alpha
MSLKDSTFNHFKIHTQYSICEGAVKIEELSKYAKLSKFLSLGISDSYNLSGALEFSEELSKAGVHPIIGTQLNIKTDNIIGKVSLIAKNEVGYKNLLKLSSKSYLDINATEAPHCSIKDLLDYNSGLFVLLGGNHTLTSQLILNNQDKIFLNNVSKLKSVFKDNLFFEIQRHNEANEDRIENFLIANSKSLKVPIIASQEVFYIHQDMYEAHDAYICIGQKAYVEDKNRISYSDQHYLKSNEEMLKLFADLPDALENNHNLRFQCLYRPLPSKPLLPNFTSTSSTEKNVEVVLQELAQKGLEIRLKEVILKNITDPKQIEETKKIYVDRLNYEVKMINQMKFSGYFLIVSDYILWAKNNNIPVGPGRGSGAGSLVAWALSITELDPIKFGLIFERFLNPDRISIPDFDIDFCQEDRDKVINYVKNKYKGGVAQIITFGKLQARMAIRDIGRVIGLPYSVVDSLSKMIPFDPSRPLSLQESVALEPRIQEAQKNDVKIDKLIKLAIKLEGLYRNIATHAAGIVIADRQIEEIVPLYKDFGSENDIPVTQFDMKWSENAGLVKFDFLGLKTLTVIKKTVNSLKENNININLKDLPLDDPKTFELLCSGETMGVFQLESAGMREVLKQMKPNKFEDIIALVALFRPGPMQNISKYNNCKHGIEKPDYLHPKIEHILKETYGVIIYQEQVMQIAQSLSGFSAGKADILRKAMGKKKSAEMERQKKDFIEGAVKNGITKDQAVYIFQLVEKFAQYGFNKSHAAAYALIAYQTAYLKTHYPFYFVAASMNLDLANTDKLNEFYEELKRLKIDVVLPSINESFADFVVRDNKVYYALAAIKAVGYESVNQIISDRKNNGPFKSLEDFILRIDSKLINKLQMEGLIKSGAFDCLESNRKFLFDAVPEIIKISKNYKEANLLQDSLFGNDKNSKLPSLENFVNKKDFWNQNEKMKNEFESIGFFISEHPLLNYEKVLKTYNVKRFSDISENDLNREFVLSGTLMAVQEKKTAKGQPFAIIKLSDLSRMYELFIFSEILLANRDKMLPGNSFLINIVKEKMTNGTTRLTTRKLTEINSIKEAKINNAEIVIKNLESINELKKILKDSGDTKVLIRVNSKDKNYAFNLKTNKLIDASIVSVLNSSGFECKIH